MRSDSDIVTSVDGPIDAARMPLGAERAGARRDWPGATAGRRPAGRREPAIRRTLAFLRNALACALWPAERGAMNGPVSKNRPGPAAAAPRRGGSSYHLSFRSGSRGGGSCAHACARLHHPRDGEYDGRRIVTPRSTRSPTTCPRGRKTTRSEYWDAADLYERANGPPLRQRRLRLAARPDPRRPGRPRPHLRRSS